jgi:hypothetical protein
MKQQVVILKIKYDNSENYAPKSWNWSQLIGCKGDCVEVMNYGKIEELPEDDIE